MTMRNFSLPTNAVIPVAFASAPPAAKPRIEPQLTAVVSGIAMPKRESKRGSTSIFPFDTLTNVGDAFGVKNRDAKSLSSIISNANRKGMVNKTDDAGNVIYKTIEMKNAEGVVVGRSPTTEPEKVAGKRFAAFDVAKNGDLFKAIKGTELDGSTVLVFREA